MSRRSDKKSLFGEGEYENLALCVKVNPTVPPGGIVAETAGPEMEGSGREEPDSEDVARGLFYPEYEKIDKNGVKVSPRTHLLSEV